ncbi:MAG: hypothetical protein ACKPGI_17340, partial [Verrucomicrobiota bacterium]
TAEMPGTPERMGDALPPWWVMQCPASLGAGAPTLRGVSLLVADAGGGWSVGAGEAWGGWVHGMHPVA